MLKLCRFRQEIKQLLTILDNNLLVHPRPWNSVGKSLAAMGLSADPPVGKSHSGRYAANDPAAPRSGWLRKCHMDAGVRTSPFSLTMEGGDVPRADQRCGLS